MRLIKFRIRNYKCIIDSGHCLLAEDLTILIGKNESGKTSVLEALRDFNADVDRFSDDVYPLDGRSDEPSVQMHFSLTREELDAILQDGGVALSPEVAERVVHNGLVITKTGQGQYLFEDSVLQPIFSNAPAGENRDGADPLTPLRSAKDKLFDLLKGHDLPDIALESSPRQIQQATKDIVRHVKGVLNHIGDATLQGKIVDHLRTFIKETESLGGLQNKNGSFLIDAFAKRLPRFVFFNEFVDILPFEINVADIKENQSVRDFAKIAGLDLDQVIDTKDLQRRINLLNRHTAHVNGDFLKYWQQNKVEIVVKPEADKLLFGVKDVETTNIFKIKQRSRGFQWFLSFYLRLQAEAAPENIILIDEPGTNLHAKAHREILRILVDKIAPQSQVVFSTHSPYLIDPKRLNRIRLLLKDPLTGSVIQNHSANEADEETLMPLMTAQGGEKPQTVIPTGTKNVVLQNAAMLYYVQAIRLLRPDDTLDGVTFLPSTDRDMIRPVAGVIGREGNFCVLLNNGAPEETIARGLEENLAVGCEKIVFVGSSPETSIEDLFTREDFNTFVLDENKAAETGVSNSQHLRRCGASQVFIAKTFLTKVKRTKAAVILSEPTLAAFGELFKNIARALDWSAERQEKSDDISLSEAIPAETPTALVNEPQPEVESQALSPTETDGDSSPEEVTGPPDSATTDENPEPEGEEPESTQEEPPRRRSLFDFLKR